MPDHSLLLETPPRGWAPASFSEVCTRVQDAASPSVDGERLYLGLEHLASGLPSLVGRGRESDVRSGKTSFRKGDVLFGKLRPYLRKSVLVGEDGICSTDILVFRASAKCVPEFLCLLAHTDEFVDHAKATTSGVQHPRTSWAGLRDFKLHVPPLPEQRKIAGVLGLVQRAMEQQERLIALTTELKKALLHQLFTQGLRGEPQKQTEIGPVPESWEVVPLTSVLAAQLQNGVFARRHQFGGGVRFANVVDMYRDTYLDVSKLERVRMDLASCSRYLLNKGDVLIVRSSLKREGIGQNCIVGELSEPAIYDCHLIRVMPDQDKILPEFLSAFWRSPVGKLDLVQRSKTVTMTTINQASISGALVPRAPLGDQREIANLLLSVEAKRHLHSHKHAALTALFRTLLHQLMTAQLRVSELDLEGFP